MTKEKSIATTSTTRAVNWHAAAALAALLPAAGVVLAQRSFVASFDDMTTHHGGIQKVARAIHEANQPVITTLLLGAAVAVFLIVVSRRGKSLTTSLPGPVLSFQIPVLVGVPILFLWAAEGFMLAVLAQRVSGYSGIAEAKEHLDNLLLGSLISAVVVACYIVAAFLGSARGSTRPRPGTSTSGAIAWAVSALALLTAAALFWSRSAYVQRVILTGQL